MWLCQCGPSTSLWAPYQVQSCGPFLSGPDPYTPSFFFVFLKNGLLRKWIEWWGGIGLRGVGVVEVETWSHISQPLWNTWISLFFLPFNSLSLTLASLAHLLILSLSYSSFFFVPLYIFFPHIISLPMSCCFHHKALTHKWIKMPL